MDQPNENVAQPAAVGQTLNEHETYDMCRTLIADSALLVIRPKKQQRGYPDAIPHLLLSKLEPSLQLSVSHDLLPCKQ